ncbi:hypothetical protein B0O99DRAFT_354896 [Bisporella sp. PMI_857]|nr:hypothetical protein B0O99DRAFT_354896 [Bisporella sp. PMI_857]
MPFNHGKTVPLEGFLAATSMLVSYVPEDQIASHNRNTDSPPPNSMSEHSPSARAKLQMITLHAVVLWGEQYSPSNTEKILLDLSESFWVILRSRKIAETSDPRDKIFAYLSHPSAPADLHGQPRIIPDYTKTMEDVFLETATLGLIKMKRAHVLTSIHHSKSSLKTRVQPSWVPDYSIASYEVCLIREVRAGFRAGGETELEVNLSNCGRRITLAGLRVDTIQNSTDQIDVDKFSENPFDAETNALFHPLEKIMEFLEIRSPEQRKIYRNARIETVALWLSSAADSTEASDEDAQQLADFYSYRKELRLALKEGRHLDMPPIDPPIPSNNTPVLQTYCDFCWDRKAYLTERGLVGLAPGAMQLGDIVCVIFGCDTPFVLRPEDNHYLLVGSCFLLGFMGASTTRMLMEEPIGGKRRCSRYTRLSKD